MKRILVAVDDSPVALTAVGLAIELAHQLQAELLAVTVVNDGQVPSALRDHDREVTARRDESAANVLRHVCELARRAGVPAQMLKTHGAVGTCVLEQARAWPADLVVMGRSRHAGAGDPFIGSQTRIVLEFADVPVLVVPPAR